MQEVESNHGPNFFPASYGQIQCGETVCGSTYTSDDNYPPIDQDWYRLDLINHAVVDIQLESALFYTDLRLYDADAVTLLSSTGGIPCESLSLTSVCLQAGHYYIHVGNNGILQPVHSADYRLSVNCTPCDFTEPCEPCEGPHTPADPWTLGTSEVDVGTPPTDYLRVERFGSAGLITAVSFRGLLMFYNGTNWLACAENPVFTITFYDRYLTQVASFVTPAMPGTTGPLHGGQFAPDYSYILPTPVFLLSGHISIQGTRGLAAARSGG